MSYVVCPNSHYVFGDLRSWGWITLILGVLQLLAAAGVLAGSQAARWFAVAVIALNTIDQMFFIPAYPFWSLLIIAMDVIALYGLCAYGSRANLQAPLKPSGNVVRILSGKNQVTPSTSQADGQLHRVTCGWFLPGTEPRPKPGGATEPPRRPDSYAAPAGCLNIFWGS